MRTARKDAQVRVPSGYWSPLSSEWRTWLDRDKTPAAPPAPVRALKRSRLIDTWYGFERGDDGRLSLVFTWEPTRHRQRAAIPAAGGGAQGLDDAGRLAVRTRDRAGVGPEP